MSLIPFKRKKPKATQQPSAPQHHGAALAYETRQISQETQDLVQFLKEIGATDIRVYTDDELKIADPADLSPSTRRMLIRIQNEK